MSMKQTRAKAEKIATFLNSLIGKFEQHVDDLRHMAEKARERAGRMTDSYREKNPERAADIEAEADYLESIMSAVEQAQNEIETAKAEIEENMPAADD